MTIHIAYWVNEKYTIYAYYSLLSILKNHKSGEKIICHLITTSGNSNINMLKSLEKKFNIEVDEAILDENLVKNIPTSLKHLDYSTFFRFSIDTLINNVDKIIYIDADTIITSEISSLYNKDLWNNTVWVISESPNITTVNLLSKLSLKNKKYFNAWVLLINLKKRRNYSISNKCLDLLKNNRYPSDDQDPLNIILQDTCKRLEWRYNVTTWYFLIEKFYDIWFPKSYYEDALKNPVIIHFTWDRKPRNLISIHPYTLYYDRILLYNFWIQKTFNLKEFIIICIHYIFFWLFPKYKWRIKISWYVWKILRK